MKTLYLIESNNKLKIGIASDLNKRLRQYKTHNPDFKILDIREGTYSDEYFLHKIFEKYMIEDTEWMVYDQKIIDTYKNIKLNHREPVSQSKSKKRKAHVKKIIETRKMYKETNTIIISANGTKKLYR